MSKKKDKKKKKKQRGCDTKLELKHFILAKVKVGTFQKHLLVYGYLHALSQEQPNWAMGGEPGGPSDTYEVEALIPSDNLIRLERFMSDVVEKHEE